METVRELKSRLVPALYKLAAMNIPVGMPKPVKGPVAPPAVPKVAPPKPKLSPGVKQVAPKQAQASVAFKLGFAQKCHEKLAALMPPQQVVDTVAERTGIPGEVIKLAYLRKKAFPAAAGAGIGAGFKKLMPKTPLGLLLGAAAIPTLAIPAARGVGNYVSRGLSGYGWGGGGGLLSAPHMGTIGGFDPKATSELQKMIAMESMRNQQLSSLLQGIRGAYQPAPSPWGMGRPMM